EYDTFLERIKIVLDGDFRIPLVAIPFVNPAHTLIIIRGVIAQDNLRTMTLQSCHDGLVCGMPTSPFSMIYDELETSVRLSYTGLSVNAQDKSILPCLPGTVTNDVL